MFLEDCVTIMENGGVAVGGVNLFTSTKSAPPVLASGAATLQIIETGGTAPDRTHNDFRGRPATIRPGARVIAAAGDYTKASHMAHLAYDEFVAVERQFINSGWYKEIRTLSEPKDQGLNARGQAQCGFTILAKIGQRPW